MQTEVLCEYQHHSSLLPLKINTLLKSRISYLEQVYVCTKSPTSLQLRRHESVQIAASLSTVTGRNSYVQIHTTLHKQVTPVADMLHASTLSECIK